MSKQQIEINLNERVPYCEVIIDGKRLEAVKSIHIYVDPDKSSMVMADITLLMPVVKVKTSNFKILEEKYYVTEETKKKMEE